MGMVTITCTALVIAGAAIATAGAAASPGAVPSHKGILPPKNPKRSVGPKPFFLRSSFCIGGKDGPGCNKLVLKATTRARRLLEKMGAMSFSLAAYEKLKPIEQLFVTVDLERTARGLAPATVLTRSLDKVAQKGANTDKDPPLQDVPSPLPGGGTWVALGGNWAGGWDNALGANYAWMYDDGPGSDNADCTKTNHRGCWGHRDNILGTFNTKFRCGGQRNELAMGAGHVARGKEFGDSETELLAGVCGRTPTDVVMTWAKAKRLLHIK
ncbi:MAG TPA: hypothetical protein VN695_10745 [Streptosporangiaceae bacterium]|nr:hypothetical protein [Streptosporangiaceae bacterium]